MTKIHIISDLDLGYNEFADIIDETIPDVDLVILNGNNGLLKRSALYSETLARKYPDIPFVLNLGYLERYHLALEKQEYELENGLEMRIKCNESWPKNLYWSDKNMLLTCKNGFKIDILCTFGWPKIHNVEGDWKDTFYFRNIGPQFTYWENDPRIFKPNDTSNVGHGNFPIWATQEYVNERHEKDLKFIRDWENNYTEYKILVTHLNPYFDERNKNLTVTPYRIHLNDMLWVTSGQKIENMKFLGGRLVSNPGRGILPRSHVVYI